MRHCCGFGSSGESKRVSISSSDLLTQYPRSLSIVVVASVAPIAVRTAAERIPPRVRFECGIWSADQRHSRPVKATHAGRSTSNRPPLLVSSDLRSLSATIHVQTKVRHASIVKIWCTPLPQLERHDAISRILSRTISLYSNTVSSVQSTHCLHKDSLTTHFIELKKDTGASCLFKPLHTTVS